MIKQLYKLISEKIIKSAICVLVATFIVSCGEENSQEQTLVGGNGTASAKTAVSDTSQDIMNTSAQEAEQMAGQVEEAATQMTNDAGFINHDMVLGDPNAPVEIIEYASITCNHCATFHNNVLPRLKEKYVDTGKAKIVMRSFLLNGIDAQGSVLSRCVPERRYFAFMDVLFGRQTEWYNIPEYQRLSGIHDQQTAGQMFIEQTMNELSKIARQVGLNQAKIDACLQNEDIQNYLFAVHQEGRDKYKVSATPTIIVNGNKTNNDYASVERAIEAALD